MHKKRGYWQTAMAPAGRLALWLPLACILSACQPGARQPNAAETTADTHLDHNTTGEAGQMKESTMYSMTVERLDGSSENLADNRGKLLLIVNTASECGLTPQYKDLQELHKRYGSRGLKVMGFPCNEFGGQEPGTAGEIQNFCQANYGVEFPMYGKVKVLGDEAAPLFRWLKANAPEDKRHEIKWNFNKFLVDTNGHVVDRFEPREDVLDKDVIARIESLLPNE